MVKELNVDLLNVKIYKNRLLMGTNAAIIFTEKINQLFAEQEFINVIFAAAPSQNEFLATLCGAKIDWSRVNAFHMDEYVGLPQDAPQRFGNFLRKALFDKIAFHSVNYLRGNAADIEAECKRYSELLIQYPVDVVCMGIGENGHIAFNDPPVANFEDPLLVKMVELDQHCRQQQVNDGCFSAIGNVPTHALTLTIPALMRGRFLYCVVPGSTKAKAVYNTLNNQIVEEYPSSILRNHPAAILFLDTLSSQQLQTP